MFFVGSLAQLSMGLVDETAHHKVADAFKETADQEHSGDGISADESGVCVIVEREGRCNLVKNAAASCAQTIGKYV